MIGRAFAYGLGAMGEAGVALALEMIEKELDVTHGAVRPARREGREPGDPQERLAARRAKRAGCMASTSLPSTGSGSPSTSAAISSAASAAQMRPREP